jgi:cold shock CspA family protein
MKPVLQKGQLTTWKDDRGFGFIKPDPGGKEVFIHISALKGAGRRPRVGDTLLYEQAAQPDGKIRATRAAIQGVAPQRLKTRRKSRNGGLLNTLIGGVILVSAALISIQFRPSTSPPPTVAVPQSETAIPQPECVIKGNISISSGRKWYHVPGMEDYASTVIDPAKGERYFCSESEAIENGWQRAPR